MRLDLDEFWRSLSGADLDIRGLDTSGLASVLVAITDSKDNPKIVLTQRAKTMNTHSGQVAFPGGRWEMEDPSLAHTALRESEEEIALSPHLAQIRGRLRERESRFGLTVYPFVAQIPEGLDFVKNPAEIHSIFEVPLRFFLETPPERIDRVERRGVRYQMPSWLFDGYEIWGLTAIILQDMLRLITREETLDAVSFDD